MESEIARAAGPSLGNESTPSERQRLLKKLLAHALSTMGKNYEPASDLPTGLVLNVARTRALWLIRGLIRLRAVVFIGDNVRLRGKGRILLGRGATIEPGCSVDGYARRGVRIGPRSRVGAHSIISSTSHLSLFGSGFEMGSDSGFGEYCYVGAAGGVTIGDNVIMGQFISFHAQQHNFDNPNQLIRQQGSRETGITIGDNCWIGARVTFLDGARVGSNSVVAAGSVVRGVFPDRTLIAGVPAKEIRRLAEPGKDRESFDPTLFPSP